MTVAMVVSNTAQAAERQSAGVRSDAARDRKVRERAMTPFMMRILESRPGFVSARGLAAVAARRSVAPHARGPLGATPMKLGWQPTVGVNTIGMLLAHIAVVEVSWVRAGVQLQGWDIRDVFPLLWEEAASDAGARQPPAGLAGRDLDYFDDLLTRARTYSREAIRSLDDATLDQRYRVRFPGHTGTEFEAPSLDALPRAGASVAHYGQINLLRRLHRSRPERI